MRPGLYLLTENDVFDTNMKGGSLTLLMLT